VQVSQDETKLNELKLSTLELEKLRSMFEKLTKECIVPPKEMKKISLCTETSLRGFGSQTPGEIAFDSLETLINSLCLKESDSFCDIGSGLGKIPLMVLLQTNCEAYGVEISKTLIEFANRAFDQCKEYYPQQFRRYSDANRMFLNQNATEHDYKRYSFVFW
jgi:hypothetical protein